MKSFFETVGFIATALCSGFLVFLYIGKTQPSSDKSSANQVVEEPLMTAHKKSTVATLPPSGSGIELDEDFTENIAGRTPGGNAKSAPATLQKTPRRTAEMPAQPVKKSATVAPTAAPAVQLNDIFTDEVFVDAMFSKWKQRVVRAASENDLRADLLLANIMVKTYLGEYYSPDFQRDVAKHRGDVTLPEAAALKSYDHAKTVAALAKMYDLRQKFLVAAPAPKITASREHLVSSSSKSTKNSTSTPKKVSKDKRKSDPLPPTVAKPAAVSVEKISGAETAARELAARELGFASWQGLQFLGDHDTKLKAQKRVKNIITAARIR